MKGKILLPFSHPDNFLEFQSNPEVEDAFFSIRSGLAVYSVDRNGITSIHADEMAGKGFSATQLDLFREDDLYGECFHVLTAHGWLTRGGGISPTLVQRVSELEGAQCISEAKENHGDNWEIRVMEIASIHFTTSLSRLWYAANMMSLYYVHYDDLRLGYLWAEYKIRKGHEADSQRGRKSVEYARAGGLQRGREQRSRTQPVLREMQRLLDAGQSTANAARLAHGIGLGTSAEANRRLWTRHRGK